MFWLVVVVVFWRFNVKDGGLGLLLAFAWGLAAGAAVVLLWAGTATDGLAVSEDPVFLAWGLR